MPYTKSEQEVYDKVYSEWILRIAERYTPSQFNVVARQASELAKFAVSFHSEGRDQSASPAPANLPTREELEAWMLDIHCDANEKIAAMEIAKRLYERITGQPFPEGE